MRDPMPLDRLPTPLSTAVTLTVFPMLRFRFCLCLLLVWLCAGFASARSFSTVVIDPGHGAHDFGAREGYVFEKHLALDISRRLERYLRQLGLRSRMTRSGDYFIALDGRSRVSNGLGNSIFVSIHINHARNTGASGLETFYHNSAGYPLASLIQQHMLRGVNHGGNRGVKHANFRVLRTNQRPAVLVECGFLSNRTDRRRLLDPAYREGLARSIGNALLQYRRM
jgi:N-acetylmuramoyl-L-alanine amidase